MFYGSLMMSLPNYYAILEVSTDASLEDIKRSYRRLARLHHPDINKNSNDRWIKQLNEAYTVLSDAAKRTAYDIKRLEELRRIVALETLILQRKKMLREQRISWHQGIVGFVRELKKHMRDG
jgi:curved DNA-binding protein CbpA